MNYRNTDPETSKEAWEHTATNAKAQRIKLLRMYAEMEDATDDEVAFVADMLDGNNYTKRCSDLRNQGLIEPIRDEDGELLTRPGLSGRSRMLCQITSKGREALREVGL